MKPIPKAKNYDNADEYLIALLQYQKRYGMTLYKEGKLHEVQNAIKVIRAVIKE